jgi:hypothetical protein
MAKKKVAKATKPTKACPEFILASIYDLEIELTECMLGTVPKNPKLYEDFILGKIKPEDLTSVQKEEIESVEKAEERGWTGFHRDRKGPFIFDYMIKGFLKSAGEALRVQSGVTNLKHKITTFAFVQPRKLYFDEESALNDEELRDWLPNVKIDMLSPEGEKKMPELERPLRAQTMQGPRVTLARSDLLAPGTKIKCQIRLLKSEITEKILDFLLQYGEFQGLGQWRSGGFGQFKYTLTPTASNEGEDDSEEKPEPDPTAEPVTV